MWLELRSSRDVAVSQLSCGPNEKKQHFTLAQNQPRFVQVPLEALRFQQHLTSFVDSNGAQVEFILKYELKENETKNVNRYCPVSGKLLDVRSPTCNYRGCVVGFASMRIKDDFERKDGNHIPACVYLDAVIKEHLGDLPGGPTVQPQTTQPPQPPRTPEILLQGAEFIKHAVGRGGPATRRIQLQDHAVCWKKPSAASASATQRLPLESITAVKSGKQTSTFSKKSSADAPADCCFSILSASRSLDLQASSPSLRDQWVEAFNILLQARQHKHASPATMNNNYVSNNVNNITSNINNNNHNSNITSNITTIHVPSTTVQTTPSTSQHAPSTPPVVISLPKAEATNVIVAGLGLRLAQETFVNPGLIVFRSEGKANERLESLECIHRSTLTMGTRCPEFGVQLVNPPPRYLRICVYHAPSAQVWGQPLLDVLHSPAVSLIGSVIVDVPVMVRNSGARLPFLGQELDSKKGIGGLMGCGLMLTVDENKEDMNLQEAIDMLVAGEPVTAYTALEDSEQFTEGTGLRNSLPVESLQLRLVPQGALPEGTSRIAPDTLIGALVLERVHSHGSGDTKVLSLESISDMYEGPQTAVFAAHFDKELLPRSVRACSFSIVSVFQKTTWNLEARNGRVRDGIIQAVYTLMTDGWPGLSSPLGAVVTTDMPPQVNENLAREDSESTVPEVRDWAMAADVSKNGATLSFGDGFDYETELSTTSSMAAMPQLHFDPDSRTAHYEFSSEAKSQSQVSSGLFEKFEVRGIPPPRFSVSHTGGISIIRGVSLNSRQHVSMSRPRSNSSRASLMSTASLISVVSQVHGGQTRASTLQDYLDSAKKKPDREAGGSVNSISRDRWSKRAATSVRPVEEKTVHAEMDSDPAIQSLFNELGSIKKASSADVPSADAGRKLEAGRNAGNNLNVGSIKGNTNLTRQAGTDTSANGVPRGTGMGVNSLTRSMSGGSNSSSNLGSSSGGGNGSSSSSSAVNSGSTRSATSRTSSANVRSQPRTPSQGPNEFANLMSLQNDIQDLKRMIQSRVPAQ